VPYIVGFVVVQAARLGFKLDNATVASALVAGFGSVYYTVFRVLEARYGAKWGWFLGAAKPPSYQPPAPKPVTPTESAKPATPEAPAAPEAPIDYSKLPEGG
jgi:hypothetical protein